MKLIVPKLYEIAKELGMTEDSDEFMALRAAFVLGQEYMRDAAIDKLGSYEAPKCAQVVASIRICSGFLESNK